MQQRVILGSVTFFWLVMNILLWRWEYSDQRPGQEVEAASVWQKILRSPDLAYLDIYKKNRWRRPLGSFRWSSEIVDTDFINTTSGATLDGMIRKATGYSIEISNGYLDLPELPRIRYKLQLDFDANIKWKTLRIDFRQVPVIATVSSTATNNTAEFNIDTGEQVTTRIVPFADLRQPSKVAALSVELFTGSKQAAPWVEYLLQGLNPAAQLNYSADLEWKARYDWLPQVSSRIRVYRLEANLSGSKLLTIYVSRVGEILRIELPNEIVIRNRNFYN
ncbi:MAG: hypothetical protein JW388_0858 [Nitrospira sp.]|nr:hypothetical protein [Nitrospira sp.]